MRSTWRRTQPLISLIQIPLNKGPHLQRFCSRSESSISSSSGPKVEGAHHASFPGFVLRWFSSGLFLVGSGLGLCYLTASRTTHDGLALVAWADAGIGDDQSEIKDTSPQKKPRFLFKEEYRKRVFFNYEKRIRTRSPPEKVFDYFASVRSPSGEYLMTAGDLMRAVIPVFPPSESDYVRGGFLMGEQSPRHGPGPRPGELQCAPSQFFMLFDTNNDGFISFPEYLFLVSLLSIPESSFCVAFKMFDLDNNGEIDREEFKKVMDLMRTHNNQGRQHTDADGRHFALENGGLIEYFFGKDGTQALQHHKFVQFFRDLQTQILKLEFEHYDHKSRGTISARDFALSMVASADMRHTTKFVNKVDQLSNDPKLKDIRITFDEFKKFDELRKSLRPLSLAIFSHSKANDGLLTKHDFQRAASHVCGIKLSEKVVDIIFEVFDLNGDGSLSSDEFLKALQGRERDNVSLPRQTGLKGLFSCWKDCTTNCSSNTI